MEAIYRDWYANDNDEYLRGSILAVMRALEAEAEANGGIIPPAMQSSMAATTTLTSRIEEDNFVSVVRFNKFSIYFPHDPWELNDQLPGQMIHPRTRIQIQRLSENIDMRDLDGEWRGDNARRVRVDDREYDDGDDYLTTLTFRENNIVFRDIQYHSQPNQPDDASSGGQIIWNSRFTWREIKQHLEGNSYNFDFRDEIIMIVPDSLRVVFV